MSRVPEDSAPPVQAGDSILVNSCWHAAVLDLSSSFCREGIWDALWRRVKRKDLGYFGFFDLLEPHERRGRLFHFATLLGGVFHARIRVVERPEDFVPNPAGLRMPSEGFVELRCPSGRIAVVDFAAVGSEGVRPTVVLEPGVYRLSVRHLDDFKAQYEREGTWRPPEGAAPDWLFDLMRTGPLVLS